MTRMAKLRGVDNSSDPHLDCPVGVVLFGRSIQVLRGWIAFLSALAGVCIVAVNLLFWRYRFLAYPLSSSSSSSPPPLPVVAVAPAEITGTTADATHVQKGALPLFHAVGLGAAKVGVVRAAGAAAGVGAEAGAAGAAAGAAGAGVVS